MELEQALKTHKIILKRKNRQPIHTNPTHLKITFELPIHVGKPFLAFCDQRRLDPDDLVAELIQKYMGNKFCCDSSFSGRN